MIVDKLKKLLSSIRQYGFDLVIVGGRDAWMMGEELAAPRSSSCLYITLWTACKKGGRSFMTPHIATPARLYEAGVQFAMAIRATWDKS